MKKWIIVFWLILFSVSSLYAKEYKYKVSDIPAELLKNAESVVRNAEIILTVENQNSFQVSHKLAITVLKEEAIEDSYLVEFYDKFRKVYIYSATLYDEFGNKIKKISPSEIVDMSAASGSLFDDNRVKKIFPEVTSFPFTVEYHYSVTCNSLTFLPDWSPLEGYNISIEKSVLKVIDDENAVRYYEKNIPEGMKTVTSAQHTVYTWEASNIKAVKDEPYTRSFYEIHPIVFLAPVDFKIKGYEGKMSTWKDLGLWINDLNEGKDDLPPEAIADIRKYVETAENDLDKVKKIYDYLQNKTRYVSIQIGLGGFQPIAASEVDKYSYGDCKALTNYTKALLSSVGIRSFYTLVKSGSYAAEIIDEFPSDQFNHIILCVPVDNDTVWLECTSQKIPFGYIGDFTDDRKVLLITEEGGVLSKTKTYTADENKKVTSTRLTLDVEGNATVNINRKYTGLKYEEIIPVLYSDQKDKKRILEQRIEFPKFDLIDFNHQEYKNEIPVVTETINLSSRNYANAIGSRLMVQCNPVNRIEYVLRQRSKRKNTVFIRRSQIETDTIIFSYPSTFEVEALPDAVEISTRFGKFSSVMTEKEGKVILIRSVELIKGEHPPETFEEFVEFGEKIVAADKNKFILKKKI